MLERQNYLCLYCKTSITMETGTIDHIHPQSKNGGNNMTNLVAACMGCNLIKANFSNEEEVKKYCDRVIEMLKTVEEFKKSGYKI